MQNEITTELFWNPSNSRSELNIIGKNNLISNC